MLQKFSYKRVSTVAEAVAAASAPGARLIAGGADLVGSLRSGTVSAKTVVSLKGVKELKGIAARQGGGLRIGALTTLTDIAEDERVLKNYPVLAQAAAAAASPQLRNQGTLGGNLCQRPRCWYFRGDFHCRRKGGEDCFAEAGQNRLHAVLGAEGCYMVHPSDTAPALVALDAKVVIAGKQGRRTIPLSSFFVLPAKSLLKENVMAPGEVVVEVLLDPQAAGVRSAYRKVRERGAFDFALVGAAVTLRMAAGNVQAARIVLSGVAAAPWRCEAAERLLIGKSVTPESVTQVAEAALNGAAAIGDNDYKIPMARGVIEETLLKLANA